MLDHPCARCCLVLPSLTLRDSKHAVYYPLHIVTSHLQYYSYKGLGEAKREIFIAITPSEWAITSNGPV